MPFHYTKIENLSLNDKPLYFRTPLTKEFIRATIFSEKYVYFHTTSLLENESTDTKCLGNFIKMNKLKNEDDIINKDRLPFYYEFQLGNVCGR